MSDDSNGGCSPATDRDRAQCFQDWRVLALTDLLARVRADERAQIVAWLREERKRKPVDRISDECGIVADAIERRDYALTPEPK